MRVKELLLNNLPVKLLSLFFAVVLWVVVIGEKQAQVQLQIPLEVVNIPSGSIVATDIPSKISIQVQGPRTILMTLGSRGIKKVVDLKGIDVGWSTIRILPDSIPMPRGVEVVAVSPSSFEIKLEPLVEKRVSVVAQIVGRPPEGYMLLGASVEPPYVKIKGGETELKELEFARTLPIKVNDLRKEARFKTGLELEGLHVRDVTPREVEVRVRVSKARDNTG
jgi:YbbR domain-containing protein